MSGAEEGSSRPSDVGKAPESIPQPVTAHSEAMNVEQPPEIIARDELLSKARTFLTSPSVQSQDVDAKRTFLREKGLSEHDVEGLLRTLVRTTFRVLFLLIYRTW
jgi:hypothetical protein